MQIDFINLDQALRSLIADDFKESNSKVFKPSIVWKKKFPGVLQSPLQKEL